MRSNVLWAAAARTGRALGRLAPVILLLHPDPGLAQPSEPGSSSGTRSEVALETTIRRGYAAVGLAELEAALGIRMSVQGIRAAGQLADARLVLRSGSSFVRYGERVYQLANAVYTDGGSLWVPVELLTRWMPSETGIEWQRRGGSVALVSAPAGGVARDGASAAPDGELSTPADERRPGPWRVVIDAGHGGKDPGAIGYKGLREKDVTLAIAKELYEQLARDPNYEPIMTRSDDSFITLMERPRVAITNDADLFISIHGNSISSRKTRGFETYFLGEARSEEAKRVAIRENSVLEYEDPATRPKADAMDYILTSLRQNMNVTESRHFAGVAQNSMRAAYDTRDRGVKQAGYWVLVGASGSMPAVLVEVGFITNSNEAKFLRSSKGQDRIAGTLADGIRRYFASYRERLVAAGGGG